MLEMYYGGECNIYGVANEIKFNTKGYSTQNGKTIDKINVHTSTLTQDNKMFDAILKLGDINPVIYYSISDYFSCFGSFVFPCKV